MTTAAIIIKYLPSTIRAACRKTTASIESSSPPVRRFAFQGSVVKALLFSVFALANLFLCASHASAKTWYIKVDGTGDSPTINAGVDSAAAGDTILVAEGFYEMEDVILLRKPVVLISEMGSTRTRIKPKDPLTVIAAINAMDLPSYVPAAEITGFWFEGFSFAGLSLCSCDNTFIRNNIFTNNRYGVFMNLGGSVHLENNTFYGNTEYGINAYDGGEGAMIWNIVWDRAYGLDLVYTVMNDFMNLSDSYPYQVNNFSLDPEFCGAAAGNFYLQSDSPCASENPPFQGFLIGALPVNCSTTSVENKTWGAVKAIYRK